MIISHGRIAAINFAASSIKKKDKTKKKLNNHLRQSPQIRRFFVI
jgi:hypothetical protein